MNGFSEKLEDLVSVHAQLFVRRPSGVILPYAVHERARLGLVRAGYLREDDKCLTARQVLDAHAVTLAEHLAPPAARELSARDRYDAVLKWALDWAARGYDDAPLRADALLTVLALDERVAASAAALEYLRAVDFPPPFPVPDFEAEEQSDFPLLVADPGVDRGAVVLLSHGNEHVAARGRVRADAAALPTKRRRHRRPRGRQCLCPEAPKSRRVA